jgi:PAS domain S-box-containing protein
MKIKGINISQWAGSLNDQQPFYVAVIDAQGEMCFTNSHFYLSFQASHAPAAPNAFFDLVHESDRQQLNETLGALSLGDTPVTTLIRVKNGHFRWVKWEISCVRMPDTRSEKFLCLGYDLAGEEQQKKTMQVFEQNYQTRNSLFTSFMDHTPYFTWIMDEDENLVFANSSLLEYFNLDPSAFGKKLSSIIPGPIASIFNEKHNLVLRCNRQDQSIIKSLMADGKEHVYQVIVFPVNAAGTGMMVGGEALDITQSYNARQEEKKIRTLETQLESQKLKQQKGIAEAIIKAQEDERTRIGHELHDNVNQILSSGQLYLSLLSPSLDNFQEIKEKTMKILQLGIEEVRKLSKTMVTPDLRGGGLVASIRELVEELRFTKLFNIGFVHSNLCDVESMNQGKKITLFRIVQEQTKNIVNYSGAKNIEIELQCGSDQVRLLIKDDGKGFDAANTHRGLGLSNIYERTRLYNGKVVLTTAPGKGCSLIVNIPF